MSKYVLFLALLFCAGRALGQVTDNFIEVRVRNDNAGELSNWLHTGDDLGETQSLRLAAGLLTRHPRYNVRLAIESTEFSARYPGSSNPRDILFTELNNLQISLDNNKFRPDTFFFSGAAGLYYIQGNKLTPGATGQKYYMHEWVISRFYPGRQWNYVASPVKDRYIPYVELKYGYNKPLLQHAHLTLNTITTLEGRLAGDYRFSGVGARTYLDLKLRNDRHRLHAIDLEVEGYYLTNVTQYQVAYLQAGPRFNFRHVAFYTQINKPLKKYLNNGLIKYDDMELQFNYGLLLLF